MSQIPSTPVKVLEKRKNEDVCRICAKEYQTKHLVKIFSNVGKAKNLSHKINFCLQINVAENDFYPERICNSCKTFVENVWKFIQNTKEAQVKLQQTVQIKRCNASSPAVKQTSKKMKPSPVIRKSLDYHDLAQFSSRNTFLSADATLENLLIGL